MNIDMIKSLEHIEPTQLNKILIIYHTFEIFAKLYKNLLESKKISHYSVETQIALSKLDKWWENRKKIQYFEPNQDKQALLKLLELWEYLG